MFYAPFAATHPSSYNGINAIVAILPMGYNMEDAFVVSQNFIDSGALDSKHLQIETLQKGTGQTWGVLPEIGSIVKRMMSYYLYLEKMVENFPCVSNGNLELSNPLKIFPKYKTNYN